MEEQLNKSSSSSCCGGAAEKKEEMSRRKKYSVPPLHIKGIDGETRQLYERAKVLSRSTSQNVRTMTSTGSRNNKYSCLCSPTTHAGSFRCRFHRNTPAAGFNRGRSVGSKLSELAAQAGTPIPDPLRAQ